MAEYKISELPSADPSDDADLIPVVQSGATKKETRSNWLVWLVTKALTWAGKQTFTLAPRFSSMAASKLMGVDSNKDLVPIDNTLPTSDQKDALAGEGTPSASNKFTTRSYVASLITGLWEYKGGFDASSGSFPIGTIQKADVWVISVAGTLNGHLVNSGDLIIAKIDSPTSSDWDFIEGNLGYTPENVSNKDTDGTLSANSDTKYASQKAAKTYSDTKVGLSGNESVAGNKTFSGRTKVNHLYAETPTALTPSGTTQTIDLDNGQYVKLVLTSATGNVTLTISNPQAGDSFIIETTQNTSGTARDVIFPSGTKRLDGNTVDGITVKGTLSKNLIISCLYNGSNFIISPNEQS